MVFSDYLIKMADWVIAQACQESQNHSIFTLAVTLNPASISETIVPVVPLGPSPWVMNNESIIGIDIFALMLASVVEGLGVINCESLYLLYRLTLFVCILCKEVSSHVSLPNGKQLFIYVAASGNKLVILCTLACKLLNPAHFQSPLMAVSSARQMLQSVISKFCLSSGTKEKLIIVIISVPAAQMRRRTIIILIYLVEYGSLSVSLRRESQGGQLRSKRQQTTERMQKAKKIEAKRMQGDIILEMYVLSAFMSPFTTISCT